MINSSISPSVLRASKEVGKGRICYLEASESSAIRDFIIERAISACREKLKLVLVCPANLSIEVPLKILSNANLAQYSLCYEANGLLSQKQKECIRIMANYKTPSIGIANNTANDLQEKELQHLINKSLDSLYENTSQSKNIKQVIIELLKSHNSVSNLNFKVDKPENIESLSACFEERFLFMLDSSILKDIVFNDSIEKLQALLQMQYEDLNKHHSSFIEINKIIGDNIQSKILEDKNNLMLIKRALEESLMDYSLRTHSLEGPQAKEMLERFITKANYLKIPGLDLTVLKNLKPEDLIPVVNDLIEHSEFEVLRAQQDCFYRQNPFNISRDDQQFAMTSMIRILNELRINNSLDIEIPTHFFQCQHLLKISAQVIVQLKLTLLSLQDEKFLKFGKLLIQSGLNINQLLALLNYKPSDWTTVVNQSITTKSLHSFDTSELEILYKRYADLRHFNKLNKHNNSKILHHKLSSEKSILINKSLNENKSFEMFLASDSEQELMSESIAKYGDIFNDIFQIVIVSESELHPLLDNEKMNFDEFLFIELKEWDHSFSKRLKNSDVAISIASSSSVPINKTQLKNNWELQHYYSNELNTSEMRPFSSLNTSEKYHQSMMLASNIIPLVSSFSIYQLPSSTLISFLSPEIEPMILEQIDKGNINILYTNSHEMSDLVEGFITDSDQLVVLVENGLINDKKRDELIWQLNLIQELKECQIHLIDIPTSELIKSGKDYLAKSLSSLNLTESVKGVQSTRKRAIA